MSTLTSGKRRGSGGQSRTWPSCAIGGGSPLRLRFWDGQRREKCPHPREMANASLGSGTPGVGLSGLPKLSRSPRARVTRPTAASRSRTVVDACGANRATGLPRLVTMNVSPDSASRTYRPPCRRRSLTVIRFIALLIAPMRNWRQPLSFLLPRGVPTIAGGYDRAVVTGRGGRMDLSSLLWSAIVPSRAFGSVAGTERERPAEQAGNQAS
jgi:hypothetical protein